MIMAEEFEETSKIVSFSGKKRKTFMAFSFLGFVLCLLFFLLPYIIPGGESAAYRQFVSLVLSTQFKICVLYGFVLCSMLFIILHHGYVNKYEIGIFVFLCIQMLVLMPSPENMDEHALNAYLLSYRYGISSRGWAGTIIDFMSSGFIAKKFVWQFIICALIFLCFLLSRCLGALIEKADIKTKYFVVFLVVLYLSSFTAPAAYFGQGNFGRQELYALIFMLIIIVLIDVPVLRWFIPLLCVFSIASHLIIVLFYMPVVFIILLHEALKNKTKASIYLLLLTTGIIIITCLCYVLLFKTTMVFSNAEDFANYITEKTDINPNTYSIHFSSYASSQDHMNDWNARIFIKGIFKGFWSIVINIPLLSFFICFWIQCIRREVEKPLKFIYFLPPAAMFFSVPAFFKFFDFGRWVILLMTAQFMLVMYFIYKKEKPVLHIAERMFATIRKHYVILILACLLMTFLGPLDVIHPSDNVMRLIRLPLAVFKIF
jgi:hypothetical protein